MAQNDTESKRIKIPEKKSPSQDEGLFTTNRLLAVLGFEILKEVHQGFHALFGHGVVNRSA